MNVLGASDAATFTVKELLELTREKLELGAEELGYRVVKGEEPYLTIIRLDDGRHFLDSECRYQILDLPVAVDA
jgi:hypothetical protein